MIKATRPLTENRVLISVEAIFGKWGGLIAAPELPEISLVDVVMLRLAMEQFCCCTGSDWCEVLTSEMFVNEEGDLGLFRSSDVPPLSMLQRWGQGS